LLKYPRSQFVSVASSSAKFTNAMAVGRTYRLHATTDLWWKQGATGVTAAADTADNHLLVAGSTVYIQTDDATNMGFIACIRVTADGKATLSEVEGAS
jgi:hypothetical protein